MNTTQDNFQRFKLEEGTHFGKSPWILIDQSMINDFARITRDNQFIHVNQQRAEIETNFGGTVAHGFLVLSLASKVAMEILPDYAENSIRINYGFNKVRCVFPVRSNSEVRGSLFLKKVELRKGRELKQTFDLRIEIKGAEKPAIVAEWIILTIFKN